jgi:hypothetical protein
MVLRSLPTFHFQLSQLQPLILCKQLRDLCIYRLLSRKAGFLISPLYQLFDLVLQNLRLRLRLFALTYLILIIHTLTLHL